MKHLPSVLGCLLLTLISLTHTRSPQSVDAPHDHQLPILHVEPGRGEQLRVGGEGDGCDAARVGGQQREARA
jgi:hypothetical protein